MLRKFLLPTLAIAALAGCATGYTYRGGNGDYYYGQPQVEYRYYGGYAPYGGYFGYGYGGYGGGYYYDRYGRLVYGSPFGGYFGSPYGYGSGWYLPRPRHHGDHHGHDGGQDGDHGDRPPPWRDLRGLQPRPPRTGSDDGEDSRPRVRRQSMPNSMPVPQQQRALRMVVPRESRMGGESSGGSRMGRAIRSAKAASGDE